MRVCEFPPLRRNFAMKTVAGTVFENQDKLKLVTHCWNHDRAEKDVLQEYMAYRIFNLLSEISYRVRLLRITYSNIDGRLDAKARNHYGFVIESTDELTARIGATASDLTGVLRNSLDPEQAALVYIFQLSVFKQMGQMFGLAKRVFCSSFSCYAACR